MRMPAIEGVASLYKGFVPSTCMHNAEARAWTCLWLTRTPACTMLAQSRPLSRGLALARAFSITVATRKVAWSVVYFLTYEQTLKRLRGSYS
jgi:hypothetical protein